MSDTRCPRDARPSCELDHCQCCDTWHETPTCVRCLGATNRAIRDMVEYAALLPAHAIYGQGGDPHGEIQMPGGDALVMLVGGSEHVTGQRAKHRHEPDQPCRCGHVDPTIKHVPRTRARQDTGPAAYSYPSDPNPPANVLLTWEDDWRHRMRLPASTAETLTEVAGFLLLHTGWASTNHPAFVQFAAEVRASARSLEQILHAGQRDEIGVPCIRCTKAPKLRATFADPGAQPTELDVQHHTTPLRFDQGGRRDWWECPACHEVYSPADYVLATGDEMAGL